MRYAHKCSLDSRSPKNTSQGAAVRRLQLSGVCGSPALAGVTTHLLLVNISAGEEIPTDYGQ